MAVTPRSLFLTKNTSLRGVETANGEQFFSVYDFLNFLTGRERGDEHAQKVFFYLTEETEQGEEFWSRFHEFKVQGLQGAEKAEGGEKAEGAEGAEEAEATVTPCMTLRSLQWLLSVFGDEMITRRRKIAESALARFEAGGSFHSFEPFQPFHPFLDEEGRGDVDAASGAPGSAQSKALDALDALDALESVRLGKRKQPDELECIVIIDRVAKACELIKSVQGFADAMTMLDPDWKDDARLVRRVRDFARDSVLETASSLLRPREPRAPR